MPPAPPTAPVTVLPETVQLVSVAVAPTRLVRPPPLVAAELPLMMTLVIVRVPSLLTPPPSAVEELLVTMQLDSVSVPALYTAPTPLRPWVTVIPEIEAEMPELTQNTPCVLPPLTVSRFAPVPTTVVRFVSPANVITPVVRAMVCAVANTPAVSKTIVSAPMLAFAWATAFRSEPAPVSFVLSTVNVDGTTRFSSASTARRVRGGALRIGRVAGRVNRFRIHE